MASRYIFPPHGQIADDVSHFLRHCNVVVIVTTPQKREEWKKSEVFKWCEEVGIKAQVLSDACVLKKANQGENAPLQLVQSEYELLCTERFWDKVRDARSEVGLAIGISHLRAITLSLALSSDA